MTFPSPNKSHGVVDGALAGFGALLQVVAVVGGTMALIAFIGSFPWVVLAIAGVAATGFLYYCMWEGFNAWDRAGPAGDADREQAARDLAVHNRSTR